MGNTASRNDHKKSDTPRAAQHLSEVSAGERSASSQGSRKNSSIGAHADVAETSAAAQRLKQTSTWSLGSLSGRLNWSFTGASRSSFRYRNKSTRKSFTSLQQRRSKTVWHKPITNAIFNSHFKEASRNDQFHIEHLVAKGAFGVVFKVTDKHAEQLQQKVQQGQHQLPLIKDNKVQKIVYALKVLRKSKIIEEHSVQQIKDEADIQKLCGHHPFIVQQVDSWQNRHNLHILSEYVPNGELFSKIAQFSIDLIRLYLAEIALAIDFLHNAGIIYRDAKPENILLTANYHIKLTDFGLSKWLKLGATTRTMCGTFQYMAPELLRGEPYGHAVDWWSLGVIVCQMLVQKSPDITQFLHVALPSAMLDENVDDVDNSAAHVGGSLRALPTSKFSGGSEEFVLPADVECLSHAGKDVLQRLLQVDPKQRIHSVLALQRIALYKGFPIDAQHLLSICPLNIIARDQITLYIDNQRDEAYSALVAKAFQDF